jgi:hypothetical protein
MGVTIQKTIEKLKKSSKIETKLMEQHTPKKKPIRVLVPR